ncbi:hypothetical protein BB560_004041 [Smittium megazygosporum]|uniref:Poly(A) RNA polymerase mitochondrial-like central palm domain-containing protein n=1 Tax=Smittium megazygosporum TaxID=133381 RepID=A0A2T9ZAF3_9FUNG|nr:hypothetical protein BB560_004041 [Smittium megazygosporum]
MKNRFFSPLEISKKAFGKYSSYLDLFQEKEFSSEDDFDDSIVFDTTNFCYHLCDAFELDNTRLYPKDLELLILYSKIRKDLRIAFYNCLQKNLKSICSTEIENHDHVCSSKCTFRKLDVKCKNCTHNRFILLDGFSRFIRYQHSTLISSLSNHADFFQEASIFDKQLVLKTLYSINHLGKSEYKLYISYSDFLSRPIPTNLFENEHKRFLNLVDSLVFPRMSYIPGIDIYQTSKNNDLSYHDLLNSILPIEPIQHSKSLNNRLCRILSSNIETAALEIFPNLVPKVIFFGSQKTGLGDENSDFDVVLLFYSSDGELVNIQKKSISFIAKILSQANFQTTVIYARVSIIKLSFSYQGKIYYADLSFNNVGGIIKSSILKSYAEMDKRAKNLFIWVKEWAKARKLVDGTNILNSYGFTMLVVSYLSYKNVIPSFSKMLNCLLANLFITNHGRFATNPRERQNLKRRADRILKLGYASKVESLLLQTHSIIFNFKNPEDILFSSIECPSDNINKRTFFSLLSGFFEYFGFLHSYFYKTIDPKIHVFERKRAPQLPTPPKKLNEIKSVRLVHFPDPIDLSCNIARHLNLGSLDGLVSEFHRAYFILSYGHTLLSDDVLKLKLAVLREYNQPGGFGNQFNFHEYKHSLIYGFSAKQFPDISEFIEFSQYVG